MKREGYWLLAIIVLVALSGIAVKTHKAKFGLDIDGGVRAVLQAVPKKGQAYDQATVQRILEQRLNATGVASTQVQSKPPDQFIIEIPNVRNQDAIVQQLQTTAQLEFRWYRDVQFPGNGRPLTARYEGSSPKDATGHYIFQFTDRQTNRTFHDQAYILKQFQVVLKDATQRPGATAFPIPAPLSQFAPANQTLYLTPDQQKTVQDLNQQLQDFQTLNSDAVSPLIMTGNDIESNAHAQLDTQHNEAVVELTCNSTGTEKQAHFTQSHNEETDPGGDNLMAIVLDGNVLDVPVVEEPLLDGTSQISGGFVNLNEAQNLANLLNAGALPVPLTIVETQSVEPTLGHAAVKTMELAGGIGLLAVLIFMAAYYLLPGLLADVALLIYALFAFAVFNGGLSWIFSQVTLTLPGIAGFILSIGMAVDANILIFERLKEELRNGKALRPAIDAGFKRAFTAIRDSNICTLITCFILGWLGTPEVKGFALTLGIGVGVSLFTAITVTRTFLYLLVDAGVGNNPALFGLKRQWGLSTQGAQYAGVRGDGAAPAPVNVIAKRKFFYGLSLLIIVPGLVFWSIGGLKRSIEFSGGTQVEAVFTSVVSQDAVEHALVAGGYRDNLVQMAQGGTVAFTSVKDRDPNAYLSVEKALDGVGTPYKLQSHSLVGGVISAELTSNAFEAVILASLLIILYLAFAFGMTGGGGALSLAGAMAVNLGIRAAVVIGIAAALVLVKINGFHMNWQLLALGVGGTGLGCGLLFTIGWLVAGFRFGISAIVALLHDVLVLIGSFAILGYFLNWQIDSMFIVATLTVVGFSVHDTIVIFDRLRENLRHRMRGEEFGDLANRSILQSFARSINTSFTVILTLIAMMVFGEPSTRRLITALLIGIVSGTYSSIFNATPILVDWENWLARLKGSTTGASLMPAMAPGASTSGGSAKPLRTAKTNGTTRPVAERPPDDTETPVSTGNRPSPRNKPKKRSQRRF